MRFVVLSYDDDQQQTFRDIVEAESHEAAMAQGGEAREYAVPVAAMTAEDLRAMAEEVEG